MRELTVAGLEHIERFFKKRFNTALLKDEVRKWADLLEYLENEDLCGYAIVRGGFEAHKLRVSECLWEETPKEYRPEDCAHVREAANQYAIWHDYFSKENDA